MVRIIVGLGVNNPQSLHRVWNEKFRGGGGAAESRSRASGILKQNFPRDDFDRDDAAFSPELLT